MALKYAGIQVEHREIALRNKPKSMLLASPKGTVPVLCIDALILDQSLDIMRWALEQSDPDGWSQIDEIESSIWIEKNDKKVNAKSIMGVMMLAASQGTDIKISTEGVDEKEALDSITALINDYFGEGE